MSEERTAYVITTTTAPPVPDPLAGLPVYQIRLILAAADALRESVLQKRPVEIVARFDCGVMYIGIVHPRGREPTGV